jgi:hypothetical protein
MRPLQTCRVLARTLLVGCFVALGCQKSDDSLPAHPAVGGTAYLLDAEPSGARSVIDLRAWLEEQTGPADVVLVGRVGGLTQPTWDTQRAAFLMSDLSLASPDTVATADHDPTPAHDADNCPFCRAKKKKELAGLALVQIVDSRGAIPAVDARQLLGLTEGATIVVQGQAELDKLDVLVVRAGGIYVRPHAGNKS